MKNIEDMMNQFSDMINNSNHTNTTNTNTDSNTKNNIDFSKISPEMLNNIANMFNNSSGNSNSASNIDINTLLKMKNIMEKMNSKDNPRSNLLLSLKPYLKESRKNKVDQYINLLNMGNLMDLFGNTGGGNKK
mgnify:CR=1 FL=1